MSMEKYDFWMAEAKRALRDIKCDMALRNIDMGIRLDNKDLKARLLKGGIFYRKKKRYVDSIMEMGGVLTGSSALCLYSIGGKSPLDRNPDDMDWVIGRDEFHKFCAANGMANVKHDHGVASIDFFTGRDRGEDSYGCHRGYWFYTDFDVIAADSNPRYEEFDGLKVSPFWEIVDAKMKLAEDKSSDMRNKHARDLFILTGRLMSVDIKQI